MTQASINIEDTVLSSEAERRYPSREGFQSIPYPSLVCPLRVALGLHFPSADGLEGCYKYVSKNLLKGRGDVRHTLV